MSVRVSKYRFGDFCDPLFTFHSRGNVFVVAKGGIKVICASDLKKIICGQSATCDIMKLKIPDVCGTPLSCSLNRKGTLLCAVEKTGMYVMKVPSILPGETINLDAIKVADRLYGGRGDEVSHVDWHPLSVTDSHLVVLSNDGVVRMFNILQDAESAELEFNLITNSEKVQGFMPSIILNHNPFTRFIIPESSFHATNNPLLLQTIFFVKRNGEIFQICPFIPKKFICKTESKVGFPIPKDIEDTLTKPNKLGVSQIDYENIWRLNVCLLGPINNTPRRDAYIENAFHVSIHQDTPDILVLLYSGGFLEIYPILTVSSPTTRNLKVMSMPMFGTVSMGCTSKRARIMKDQQNLASSVIYVSDDVLCRIVIPKTTSQHILDEDITLYPLNIEENTNVQSICTINYPTLGRVVLKFGKEELLVLCIEPILPEHEESHSGEFISPLKKISFKFNSKDFEIDRTEMEKDGDFLPSLIKLRTIHTSFLTKKYNELNTRLVILSKERKRQYDEIESIKGLVNNQISLLPEQKESILRYSVKIGELKKRFEGLVESISLSKKSHISSSIECYRKHMEKIQHVVKDLTEKCTDMDRALCQETTQPISASILEGLLRGSERVEKDMKRLSEKVEILKRQLPVSD